MRQALLLMEAEREATAVRVMADAERYRLQALARAQAETIRIVSGAIHQGWSAPELVGIKTWRSRARTGTVSTSSNRCRRRSRSASLAQWPASKRSGSCIGPQMPTVSGFQTTGPSRVRPGSRRARMGSAS